MKKLKYNQINKDLKQIESDFGSENLEKDNNLDEMIDSINQRILEIELEKTKKIQKIVSISNSKESGNIIKNIFLKLFVN